MSLDRTGRRRIAALAAIALVPAAAIGGTILTASGARAATAKQMERLDRGLISVHSSSGNLVSWRLLGTDPQNVSFNLYRGSTKLNGSAITGATDYLDSGASASSSYTVRAVINGVEQGASSASLTFANGYLDVPISKPSGGTTPDGVSYTYTANDASVGDLDGDGQLEIVLKWDPTNSKDNSQSGYTGDVFVDAYKLNGTRMWRIDLGRNIRAGAHYTQFQVYDYDGDGAAEVAMKIADGTVDGKGVVFGSSSADYRNSSGYVLSGPEYLGLFTGASGGLRRTATYDPVRGTVSSWGDSYGNRVDRFLAGTAYLDGQRPSIIMARGYYTRTVITAWDWRDGNLTERWKFDSAGNSLYESQGNHQLSIADVDGDGKDEIMYGSMAIDDNGQALWGNNTHHGDAYHVGDLIPSRPGLEVFKPSEHTDQPADWMGDAKTGAIIWKHASCGCDNGRGVSGDVYAGSPGAESWSSAVSGLSNTSGANIGRKPGSTNFLNWWDGDPVRELLDSTHIDKYGTSSDTRLLTGSNVHSNNSTKATPSLSGDILGDWREEVIWPTSDDTALRIYSTPIATSLRLPTLLHDVQYREAIAWQNTAYNQPPHPSFFLGDGMSTPAWPNIYVPGGTTVTTSTSSTTSTTTTSRTTTTSSTTSTTSRTSTTTASTSGTTTTSRTTTTTGGGGGGGSCSVNYAVASDWGSGFVANVTITNTGAAVNGWSLTFTWPGSQTIANGWNGTFSQSGQTVTVKDAGYNAPIASGASTSFGFQGNGASQTPTNFALNGNACSAG